MSQVLRSLPRRWRRKNCTAASTLGFDKFRFDGVVGLGSLVQIDLAFEGKTVGEVLVRGFIGPREKCVKRRRVAMLGLADLDIRVAAVFAPRHIAVPEVDMPARELPDALETVRVCSLVLARQRDVATVDRHALISGETAVALVHFAE